MQIPRAHYLPRTRAGWTATILLVICMALGKRFGYITPADMLADFYESDTVRVLTAAVSVIFTILYIQVQSQGLGYVLSVSTVDLLVTLITLSGAGALQLMPAILGVCYTGRRATTRNGVIAGIIAGLLVLYLTRIVIFQPLGIHEAVWSLGVNFIVTIIVSRFSAPPSDETRSRIHGEIERFVYGD